MLNPSVHAEKRHADLRQRFFRSVRTSNEGFTLIEIIVTMTILSMLVVIGALLFSTVTIKGDVLNTATDIKDTLRRAQWQTMLGREDDTWGVHVEATQFTLFKGTSYSVSAPDNVVAIVPNSLSVTGTSLNGGGSDVLFDDEYGDTTTYGTITITSDTSDETATVTINEVGMIEVN